MELFRMWFEYVSVVVRANLRTERGASLVEYALLVSLIGVVCIASLRLIGTSASATFSKVGTSINP
jgi:pilus assembly protein Flp/PilA